MKKLFYFLFFCKSFVFGQVINAPGDCISAYRLCDASVSYDFQLVNDGVIDDAYPAAGINGLFRSNINKWEGHSAFLKFTAKYSGEFKFTVCPTIVEKLNFILFTDPVCEYIETGDYTTSYEGLSMPYDEPTHACIGIGANPYLPPDLPSTSFPLESINLVAGSNYILFVRTRNFFQPGTHRFNISFQGNAVTSHPDLFEHPDCLLATSNEKVVNNFLSVYPNPFNDIVNIKSNVALDKTEIYDLVGKLVYQNSFTPEIDTAFLKSGIYFVKLYRENNEVFVRKIVKR